MNDALSPVALVEEQVLTMASTKQLDVGTDTDRERLLAIIRHCAEQVNSQLIHPVPLRLLIDTVTRNLCGYGPLEPLLNDPDVWEIMVNAPDEIFVKRHRGPSGYHADTFHDDQHVERTLTRILARSSGSQRALDPATGLQDAQLDDGSRLHIVHPQIGKARHYLVNIRRFTGVTFTTVDELVQRQMLTSQAAQWLNDAVMNRSSVLIAGEPGAGKTTLLGCLAAKIDPTLRVVTAEDVFELDIAHPNVAAMQTRPQRADQPAVDLRRLVAGFLRMAPDVAIVGEVRDQEALPLLLTLSSGVTGYATIHAASARQALNRLRFLAQLSHNAAQVSPATLDALVSESVDVVVHCRRSALGPRVNEIVMLTRSVEGQAAAVTPVFLRNDADELVRVAAEHCERRQATHV